MITVDSFFVILRRSLLVSALGLFIHGTPFIWAADTPVPQKAVADSDPFELDELVISARGRSGTISQTPGGVGVLLDDELFMSQPLSITDASTRLPGVSKSSDSAWGSAINVRGLGRNQVVYMLDDVRINTATDINAQFGLVNPADVARMEILKGPISALYGSGALGGVVNVYTKKGTFTETPEWHGSMTNTFASNPSGVDTHADVTYSNEQFWVYVSGSFRDRDDFADADGDEVRNSQFDDWHGKLRLGWRWDDANTTELQYIRHDAHEVGIPGQGLSLPVGPDVTYPDTTLDLLSLTHTYDPDSDVWVESKLVLFYEVIERRARIDNFAPPVGAPTLSLMSIEPGADHTTIGAKWLNTYQVEDHTLVTGVDWWTWNYEGERIKQFWHRPSATVVFGEDSPLADSEQTSIGIFAEDDWDMHENLTLNVGGRIDHIDAQSDAIYNWNTPPLAGTPKILERDPEQFSDISWTAHLGLTWTIRPEWSMTWLGATGYRAPDLMDRFKYINLGGNMELHGNPDLDPERSLFLEWGVHYRGTDLQASASLFHNTLDDLIAPVPTSATRQDMQNIKEARIWGAEIEAEWRVVDDWRLYGNAAYARGRDTSADDDLRFMPPLNGLLGMRYENTAGWSGWLEAIWATAQNQTPVGVADSDAWIRLDAGLGYVFGTDGLRHTLQVRAKNLTNTDYSDYLTTSRGIVLSDPGMGAELTWKVEF